MYITGPYITGAGGGEGIMLEVATPDAARRVAAYWAEEGAGWFKAYAGIRRAELGALIEEAHKHGAKVTAHLCSVGYREAVALGIDDLEHGLFTNSEYDPAKKPDDQKADEEKAKKDKEEYETKKKDWEKKKEEGADAATAAKKTDGAKKDDAKK